MLELIFTWFLLSNAPVTLDGPYPSRKMCLDVKENCLQASLQVHTRKDWENGFYIDLKPYVMVNHFITPKRAGAIAEFGWQNEHFALGYYHHSSHNLDINGDALNLDGIRLTWKLSK